MADSASDATRRRARRGTAPRIPVRAASAADEGAVKLVHLRRGRDEMPLKAHAQLHLELVQLRHGDPAHACHVAVVVELV
eukprot:6711778-Prymnesium_polylepis.1